MTHKNHNQLHNHRHKKSSLGSSIPPKYGQYPPQLIRWTTDIDNYARKKKHRTPRALRHHYE